MITRATTVGNLKTYRLNLNRSNRTLNNSMNTVITGRSFNSFAENPTAAARSYQLRKSYLRTASQNDMNESAVRKYEIAYSAMDKVESVVDTESGSAYMAIIRALNGPDKTERNILGQAISSYADDMVQSMNGRYGDNFVFSGADGLNVPLSWGAGGLEYRGVPVEPDNIPKDAYADGTEWQAAVDLAKEQLEYFANEEKKYVDLGLGYDLNGGQVENSSVYDISLQAINFLGGSGMSTIEYEGEEVKVPNNIISITKRIGELLQTCDNEGNFANIADETEFNALVKKFEETSGNVKAAYTDLSTDAQFLKNNQKQLKSTADTLNEQIQALDYVDDAAAIEDFVWAKYCYDKALKVGNSVLAQSLMDYMNL